PATAVLRIAKGRKQTTPNGIVTAMPWIGVPVTTPRRAATLLSAKVAADSTASTAPSICVPPSSPVGCRRGRRKTSTRRKAPRKRSWELGKTPVRRLVPTFRGRRGVAGPPEEGGGL